MPEDHSHLKRLSRVWVREEIYFVTACVQDRRPLLACPQAFAILQEEFQQARDRHGWLVGAFVVMPDHLHFFCAPGSHPRRNLSGFVGSLKQWSSKRLIAALHLPPPLWQKEFFDHLLRSEESYAEKACYVRENPVRAGLVEHSAAWPWQGEIECLRF